MKLSDSNGNDLELTIKGYEFPALDPSENDEYDLNWLEMAIRAKDSAYQWEAASPCLLTWEAKNLHQFLYGVARGRDYDKLYFESPELSVSGVKQEDGSCLISFGFWLGLHPYDDEDDIDPYYLDFRITKEELMQAAADWALELLAFPQRGK